MSSSREFKGLPALADVNIKVKRDSFEDNEPTPYRVIVKNFPPEATEQQLKELFSKVGSITMFKIIEPGVGVAYFREPESTYEAVKELDEYGGTLSVELDLNPTLNNESQEQDGDISKAVASLPPEQMFELMKQMKLCILNNPQEARSMLHQNPQLAYALLQAQVIMRIVDCESAFDLLKQSHYRGPPVSRPKASTATLHPPSAPVPAPASFRDPRFAASETSSSAYDSYESSRSKRDPRQSGGSSGMTRDPRNRDPRSQASTNPNANVPLLSAPMIPPHLRDSNPEKAALIMQVFQLTDEQIASLPYEQRMSIMELKKQINNSNK